MTIEDMLMEKIASGDTSCFDVLYGMWARRIWGYVYRSMRSPEDANDIVQETFLQVWRAAPTYRPEGRFAAFVFRIAANFVRAHFRKHHLVSSLSDLEDDETVQYPELLKTYPEDAAIDRIDAELLLAALPERQANALKLVASGMSYADAASEMGISVEAFAQLVLRGRRSAREHIKRKR